MLARAFYGFARTPGYKAFINVLAFIGIAVHEVAHYTLGTLFGSRDPTMFALADFYD